MPLNIKDPEAHALAKAIALETGETMTHVVTEALRQRLVQVRRRRKPGELAKELLEIGRRCASTLKGPPVDHGEFLYDEQGLPK